MKRVYLVMSKNEAYIGKGPDNRINDKHNNEYWRVKQQSGAREWASKPFSSNEDALIAEATAIGIVKCLGSKVKLINKQKSYLGRFASRYPIRFIHKKVKKSDLPRAIIITLSSDKLPDDDRPAPNSDWKPEELAERARKYWKFAPYRVKSWEKGIGAPNVLVAVAKGSGRILAAFKIDNHKWVRRRKTNLYVAVPVENNNANFKGIQGMEYTGPRQGGNVFYGSQVA